jgi:hypothetical protein
LAGEFVRLIEPHTEADPAALLVQTLVAFGAYVARGPHYKVEGDEHHCNLFAVVVGESSKARKGTSWGRVRSLFEQLPSWKPYVSGLASGEGIKYHVRDPRIEEKTDKEGRHAIEIVDQGVADKRLFVVEPEFASVLKVSQRQGSTLSSTIREAWDSGNLRTLTKNDPITATGAHICVVAHITADELRAELTSNDTANGFANRFLFVASKRSKLLPFGGADLDEALARDLVSRFHAAADGAHQRSRMHMDDGARDMWAKVYPTLSSGGRGLHGSVTARGEAQVVRLALIYALLDQATTIGQVHLLAALAVWQYCDDTAKFVFGDSLGDQVADEILRKLQRAGESGMTRTDIRDVFHRHQSTERIGVALEMLRSRGLATSFEVPTAGRSIETWRAAA